MTQTVDIHAHIVPEHFPKQPACCANGWPHMHHHPAGGADVMIDGKAFRRLDSRSWDVARRLGDMDAQGVAMQALSPMPELLSYWLEAEASLEMGRWVNSVIAGMISRAPTRFAGLGMVPLQDPELAAGELARLKADGLAGVQIGSNILGKTPGSPIFDPFFAEAERLGMAVFVHALHPLGTDRLVGPRPLAAFIGFPSDTGFAAASFITGGTLARFPRLRLAFSHGGGTLASILPRLHQGWTIASEMQAAFASPRETARRMFYDNILFDAGSLRQCLHLFGETQILAGSDYPFVAGQNFPGRPFEALGLDAQVEAGLKSGNAKRFLGLT